MFAKTPEIEERTSWSWEKLHKTVGQIIFLEPCESDLAEGMFMTQAWFVVLDKDGNLTKYLLEEWDIRKGKN